MPGPPEIKWGALRPPRLGAVTQVQSVEQGRVCMWDSGLGRGLLGQNTEQVVTRFLEVRGRTDLPC